MDEIKQIIIPDRPAASVTLCEQGNKHVWFYLREMTIHEFCNEYQSKLDLSIKQGAIGSFVLKDDEYTIAGLKYG